MVTTTAAFCFGAFIVAVDAAGQDAYRLFWVPYGDDPLDYPAGPTVIDARELRGTSFAAEVYLQHAPEPARGVQLSFNCTAMGERGFAHLVDLQIHSCRPDFVFPSACAGAFAVNTNFCPDGDAWAAIGLNSGAVSISEPRYVASVEFTVAHEAMRDLVFEWSDANFSTLVLDGAGGVIPNLNAEPLVLRIDCDEPGTDCDGSGVADECEVSEFADCNRNFVPDECEIADGSEDDADLNGVPDSCQAFRMYLIPAGADPADNPVGATVLNAPGLQGSTLDVEVFIAGAPASVRGTQLELPCSADDSGAFGGSVEIVRGTSFVDDLRTDRFTVGCGGFFPAFNESCDPNFRAVVAGVSECPRAQNVPSYVMETSIEISPDAGGTFVFEFFDLEEVDGTIVTDFWGRALPDLWLDPLVLSVGCLPKACGTATDCVCPSSDGCTLGECVEGVCEYLPRIAGDVDVNGKIDILDIFCVLDAYRGMTGKCTPAQTDLAPCEPDGKVDLRDILAVLDAFAGINACLDPCGTPLWP